MIGFVALKDLYLKVLHQSSQVRYDPANLVAIFFSGKPLL